jgi:hypothetical protein
MKEFPKSLSDYKEGERSFRINSFFTHDDKRHLYIFIDGGNFRCFKSGQSGDFIWLVKNYKKLIGSKKTIENYIYENYYMVSEDDLKNKLKNIKLNSSEIFKRNGDIPELKEITLPEEFLVLDKRTEISEKFLRYLYNRGLKFDIIKNYNFHYCVSGDYKDRVIIPVYDNKKIVYFMARHISDKASKKYLNPKREEVLGNGTGSILFNIDKITSGNKIIITEGVFNALHYTNKNFVICSVFGKVLLYNQLKKMIKKEPSEIILAYDNDKYFLKSTKDSINFIKHETDIPVSVIDWSKYKRIDEGNICDFGDLYKSYKELPIYTVSTFEFLKKFIL